MSIEQILTDLTAALKEQTAVMKQMIAGAKPGAAGKPAAAGGKPASTKTASTKPAAPSAADVAANVTAYLKAGDADDRATAKANVGKIIEHFGAERFTVIPPESMVAALKMLETFKAGGVPDEFADGDEGEEEEEDMV